MYNTDNCYYVQVPQNEGDWRKVASEFSTQWNFPHCIGALDGKHVHILPPPRSGSLYYNYKHFNSIVLMAVVDACYRFMYVDIGSCGRISDGGVFNSCSLSGALENNQLSIPAASNLPQSDIITPYVIVADDAFALRTYLIKPFSARNLSHDQRIFNYRLSRARRVVENAFGIMCSRFRVYGKAIPLAPEKVQTIVLATCCLHNFLLRNPSAAAQSLPDDVYPTSDLKGMSKQTTHRASDEAMSVRDRFCRYFCSDVGKVGWQEKAIM